MAGLSTSFAQKQFDGKQFFNPFPDFEQRGFGDVFRWIVWDRLRGKRPAHNPEDYKFELKPNNGGYLKNNSDDFSVTWIGHSTLLIQMNGMNILTDPIFSDRCSPVQFVGPKRVVAPGISLDSLPPIDLVVISHDHYDHLDKNTIKALGNKTFYVVPLGVGEILKSWGITNFQELDWWSAITFNQIRIVCTPAQHFSGRKPLRKNKTLWASWLLKGKQFTFYYGGDSGYFPGYREISEREGPVHVAALPIGAYEPRWFMSPVHTNPQEALKAFLDLQARIFIPIHWGTFILSDEALTAPPEVLRQEAREMKIDSERVRILKHGETQIISDALIARPSLLQEDK